MVYSPIVFKLVFDDTTLVTFIQLVLDRFDTFWIGVQLRMFIFFIQKDHLLTASLPKRMLQCCNFYWQLLIVSLRERVYN